VLPDNVPILGYDCTLFGVHEPCVSILESLHLFVSARHPNLDKRDPSRRITDAHLFGYRGSRPGWLAGRIASVVAAVEALRIAERRSAAFDTVRRVLLGNPGGQLLIEKFRGGHSRV
jgi:hypothetical protein